METIYFEKPGVSNTKETLELAVKAAYEYQIKNIVIATTGGDCAKMMADEIPHEGIAITVVTHAYGQSKPNSNPMSEELRQYIKDQGIQVCTAAHALSGAERALSNVFTGVYPVEVIAHTLRMFGQGTKVCVEICAMACDGGYIPSEEKVIAVGGTGRGADTAMIIRPQVTCHILKTKIDRIICKPIE